MTVRRCRNSADPATGTLISRGPVTTVPHRRSGLQATIAGIGDDTVDLEIAPGVVTRWMKLAVRDRIVPETSEIGEASAARGALDLTETDADRLSKD
jgi:preprotein translocase subunit YajC